MLIQAQNKIIGELADDIFTKQVKKSKHLFRNFDAWGIDYEAFKKYLELKNVMIIIKETEEKQEYKAHALTFINHGVIKDYGHGKQILLSRKYFNQDNDKQESLV